MATEQRTTARSAKPARDSTGQNPLVKVFISYARADSVIALALKEEIEAINRDRVQCFLDSETIQSGEGWQKTLERALREADWLVCVYTGEQSEFCGYEIGVFTRGKALAKQAGDSRLVCLHDVTPFPTVFQAHQNRWVDIPPKASPSSVAFDEQEFYQNSALAKFFADLARYKNLYMPADVPGQRHKMNALVASAKKVTEAFRLARDNDIRADTPTQLSLEVTVAPQARALTEIPGDSLVKGTFHAFELFGLLPDYEGSMPTFTWQALRDASRSPSGTDTLWIERIERDMLGVARNEVVRENDATFSARGKTYRAILFRSIVHWNDTRRFGIVFVPTLPRHFGGEKVTSMILAGLVVASRFRFSYFEQPSRIEEKFGAAVTDFDFQANFRQFVYDLDNMRRESVELGILDKEQFVASFGPSRRATAEGFMEAWRAAKEAFDQEMAAARTAEGEPSRQSMKAAVLGFLDRVRSINARFLEVALEAYSEELKKQLAIDR